MPLLCLVLPNLNLSLHSWSCNNEPFHSAPLKLNFRVVRLQEIESLPPLVDAVSPAQGLVGQK